MKYFILLALLFSISSCTRINNDSVENINKNSTFGNNYGALGDGLFIEIFENDSLIDYDSDNRIYIMGRKIVYNYTHFDSTGNQYVFAQDNNNWEFLRMCDSNEKSIRSIEIVVERPDNFPSDYPETMSSFIYPPYSEKIYSGIIENEKNVWMHPPRYGLFKILELNPFPFIQRPFAISHTWHWALEIGSQYGDKRWASWTGNLHNDITYTIAGIEQVVTKIGSLNCYRIDGVASNSIGTSKLTSFFNTEFGFVKMIYNNIDCSTTILELESFSVEKNYFYQSRNIKENK